jgi:hypothetical protein
MPHYADGTLAKVGDVVLGTSYNKGGVFVGVIKKITSEGETCNAVVDRKIAVYSSIEMGSGDDGVPTKLTTRTNVYDDGEDYTEVRALQLVSFLY